MTVFINGQHILWKCKKFENRNRKNRNGNGNAYSSLVKEDGAFLSVDAMSILLIVILLCGQIVTMGNGISEMSAGGSVKLRVIGLSRQSIQMLWAAEPHKQSDTLNAINHNNLIGFFLNCSEKNQ